MSKQSLNELLKWSIINQATEKEDASAEGATAKPLEKLDPSIIDAILGKSEAQQMVDAMTVIKSPNATEEQKEIAWEDFEMLVEQIDNASNVENMKLWAPILEELKNENPKFREQAAWVCGTTTNNNPKAQAAENGLTPVIELLSDPVPFVRAKAIYALNGAIKHYDPALAEFKNKDGYKILVNLLKTEADLTLLRKVVFLINNLLIQDPECNVELARQEIVHVLSSLLEKHMEDEDLVEKTLVTLKTFFEVASSPVPPSAHALIRPKILEAKKKYGDHMLDSSSWAELEKYTA
ncbi:hsp70 nucleotide exchange factor fes1 [Lunasporangiospora selenospora]|uniref:Hsp70 nucleotide exchange factor fes1 n=1 Tax=Lunasporangiospora selenospora TaxID=979761 RepID=A0A9P6FVA9_9FUNG|nr:hsp70 nucleotide exchange factor fes1 [Lunasporangiospora selenospora]